MFGATRQELLDLLCPMYVDALLKESRSFGFIRKSTIRLSTKGFTRYPPISSQIPSPDLIPDGTRLFVIYVTSPVKMGWSRLEMTVPSLS